jgi:hypothetical protein
MQQIVRTLMMPVSSVYANLVAYGVKRRRLPDAHQIQNARTNSPGSFQPSSVLTEWFAQCP